MLQLGWPVLVHMVNVVITMEFVDVILNSLECIS